MPTKEISPDKIPTFGWHYVRLAFCSVGILSAHLWEVPPRRFPRSSFTSNTFVFIFCLFCAWFFLLSLSLWIICRVFPPLLSLSFCFVFFVFDLLVFLSLWVICRDVAPFTPLFHPIPACICSCICVLHLFQILESLFICFKCSSNLPGRSPFPPLLHPIPAAAAAIGYWKQRAKQIAGNQSKPDNKIREGWQKK